MNKDFLPFYNDLSQEDKEFWLECSKEELIDHFVSNLKNAECLLNRINKAIEYIEHSYNPQPFYKYLYGDENGEVQNLDKLLNILKGENNG